MKLPNYKTIEQLIFPLEFSHGDIFDELDDFITALHTRDKNIHNFCILKVGKDYIVRDYPKKLKINDDSNFISFMRIENVYYSKNYQSRVLISNEDMYNSITVIYQTAV